MQSFENKPPSSGQRPGASLAVDTGSHQSKSRVPSPPRTPNTSSTRIGKGSAAAASRALRVRTGPRETFLEDITPIDGGRRNASDVIAVRRDSHDLSLFPQQVTRDSLVDHMLLSFDQLSHGHDGGALGATVPTQEEDNLYNTFGDDEIYPSYVANHNNRTPGHGHSYSSDYESQQTTRPSSQTTRGRRSNSSSNFQTALGRLNSIRNEPNGTTGPLSRPPQAQSRALHSRSGKGSKGSSANSLDLGYTQATGSHRWGQGIGGRSSSFDFGQDRQMLNHQINTTAAAFSPYDYDAAPTPTVPVGPRRELPVAYSPPLPETMPAPPIPKTIERKRSTRSSKSAYKAPNNGINGLGISYTQGTMEKFRELPPLPAFVKEAAAPAPSIGYGKSKDTAAPPSKPGFFRRVFGSSKRNDPPASEPTSAHGSTTSVENGNRPSSKPQHISSMMNSQPPSREAPPPPPKEPHVITKRPSSFFRRRKKSISEPEAPPPLPRSFPAAPVPQSFSNREDLISNTLPSPVSSLRQVMNPYLERALQNPNGLHENVDGHYDKDLELDDEDVKGFSPGYNPNVNATIRTIKPTSQGSGKGSAPASHDEQSKDYLEINIGSRLRTGSPSRDQPEETFLQDNSDNDRDLKSSISRVSKENSDKRVPSPIPPESVARDIALVANYERLHSKRPKATAPAELFISKDSLVSAAGSQLSKTKFRDDEWIMITPTKSTSDKEDRAWPAPSHSEDDLPVTAELQLPLEDAKQSARTSASTGTGYKSAKSVVGGHDDDDEPEPSPALLSAGEAVQALDELPVMTVDAYEPTEGDRERAKKIYDGNEDFIQKAKAAAWMGEDGEVRRRTLQAYMELYDFANLNILAAMRLVCGKLILKAESQQVDRILDAFAKRWCQSNPNHGFKATDVVHTICYSVLLLNTDLHMADIESKMTRSQFVKNTLPTILRVVADAAPGAFESGRPTILPSKSDESGLLSPIFQPNRGQSNDDLQIPGSIEKPSWRSSLKPPVRSNSDERSPTPLGHGGSADDCGPLVRAPFYGTMRAWEIQIEIVLKEFYGSIRADRLPLFGAGDERSQPQQSQGTLSVITHGMLRRTPSVLSKATSEALSTSRGRTTELARPATGRWQSKNRSRPRFYPGSTMGSSRTSLDDQSSMWSPSVSSSTWSKYSLGKTQTSMSVDSFGSNLPQGDYQSSIGFANALSQAIIREEAVASRASTGSDELRVAPLLEDESLGLVGAPWAKEGLVKHKHHLEAAEKKAKDRNWNEVFAVIEKGYMTLFSFSAKSMRNKSKSKATGGGLVVGGGNWQDNAENLGSFLLRQTIASALPPPGYSKARPHVWALSLPTGAVHLFQVGTPEIVKEFVSTANYWSARLSNHPLVGGISNIEYGWSDAIVNNALVQAINDGRPSTSGPRPSIQSSLRSSLDQGPGSFRSRLPGDKVIIADWTPPTQSMRSSNLMAQDQLRTLVAYVQGIEDELQKHNQLRSSMLLAFTPRHYNAQKAMANWEKKSSYLLREIVKFRTYMDCLQAAETQKLKIYAEREAERALREGEDDNDEGDTSLRPE